MNKAAVALVVLLLLSSVFVVVSEPVSAQSSGVIRIKADGTVTGTDKIRQYGLVYTLTGDLYASVGQNEAFIFIEKSDITLNGAGYTVQGTGGGSAIYMLRSQNVTVENFIIQGFSRGIDFGVVENWPSDSNYLSYPSAFNNKIRNNKIEVSNNINESNQTRNAGWGVYLSDAIQTVIVDNNFTGHNPQGGVYLGNSTKETSLIDNNFAGGGVYSLGSNQTRAVYGNTIDGKPLVYLDSKSNQIIENAGLVYLFNCSNIVVKNISPLYVYAVTIQLIDTINSEISNSSGHVFLGNSNYNSIHDNQLNSISLDASSHNKMFANKITGFSVCIKLYGGSSFNKIYGNLFLDTIYSKDAERVRKEGFNTAAIQLGDRQLGGSFNNDIHDNMIINHDCGFEFFLSSNNTLTANIIKDCNAGIQLGRSHYNTVTENNITSCKYGISIYAESSNNTFHHNNFINNQLQCVETHQQTLLSDKETYAIGNTWDNGQTGNYWDTYTGIDTNGDGIGDTPYRIFENMTDHYPLMKPFISTNANIPQPSQEIPPPTTEGPPKTILSKETSILIIAISIITGVTIGVLVYFRRLIFR
ncbi:MAG: right-handed parallel beta-helix repeat-containing protein [Candidatus Bathyarchaeota archaeon]|nr:right-handed parallel beta-helix repeat-containing protein [Candidatus Termiticorpusculum sp.]